MKRRSSPAALAPLAVSAPAVMTDKKNVEGKGTEKEKEKDKDKDKENKEKEKEKGKEKEKEKDREKEKEKEKDRDKDKDKDKDRDKDRERDRRRPRVSALHEWEELPAECLQLLEELNSRPLDMLVCIMQIHTHIM